MPGHFIRINDVWKCLVHCKWLWWWGRADELIVMEGRADGFRWGSKKKTSVQGLWIIATVWWSCACSVLCGPDSPHTHPHSHPEHFAQSFSATALPHLFINPAATHRRLQKDLNTAEHCLSTFITLIVKWLIKRATNRRRKAVCVFCQRQFKVSTYVHFPIWTIHPYIMGLKRNKFCHCSASVWRILSRI